MISLTKYTLEIMSNLGQNNNNPAGNGNGNAQNPEGIERGSCLLRYASQNSLDESSQKHIQRPNINRTVGQYHNEQHTIRSFEALNEMRKQNLLCDVILIADDIEIPAHKMVLASCSPYFYAMFTGFEESRQERIVIQGVDHIALELLIEYVYTSCVEVNEDNVQALLTAANLLQLTDVREACCDYLQTQLDASNCLGIRDFADMHGCVDLFNYADTYIEQHFNEVIQFDEFLNLNHDQVMSLIKNDRICVPSEEKVYECVIQWIRYDPTMREQHTSELLEHVRLPFLSKEYIAQRVDKEPLLEGNIKCKDLIIEALTYHLMPNETKSMRTVPRKPVGLPKILLVIGGQAPKAIRSVECYDLREEKWYQAAEMPNRRCRAGLAVLGEKVYAIGGFNGSLRVRTVDVYDPSTDQWSTSTNMEARRSTLGVAVLNGCIYAVGGFDGTTGLCSAEVFDPKTKTWTFIASMSTRRSSVGVGVVNGWLYAVGGYDGYSRQCLSSVERYNPENDTWTTVAEMSARRSGAGVGVLNNILYAVGGHDGPMVRKSVEAYDPETNQWHTVSDMAYCRRNAGVVAHDGLLYVVGGDDGTSNLSSVEVYSPENQTWRLLPACMTIGRSYAVAGSANGNVDDENSQAEGTVEGAVNNNSNNGNNQQMQPNHPHYENIYESIERYNVAPADEQQQQQQAQQQNFDGNANQNANANNHNPNGNAGNNNNAQPLQQQQQQQQRLLSNLTCRNDLFDRSNVPINGSAYDVPRAVRSGLGFRRNFQIDWQSANRYNATRNVATSSVSSGFYGKNYAPRQRSFDDTESHNYYNLNYQPTVRYENIYEQIRDEPPVYRNAGTGARVYGRLNVIGHGIGRIERHLSSSCGNIDHFNVGGHYAVLGHSHFGTVGHIRLNANSNNNTTTTCNAGGMSYPGLSGTNCINSAGAMGSAKDANVKNSASSFFSCLHGENSQSLNNIYRATGGTGGAAGCMQQLPSGSNNVTPNNSKERAVNSTTSAINNETPSTSTRQTGAIPKIKSLNIGSSKGNKEQNGNNNTLKNALTKKTSTNSGTGTFTQPTKTLPEHSNGTLNRISKSSLQWLLVNKWLPLWIGQGPDCKVIDFNFMFSRDCVGCDAASTHVANPYESPRLGNIPQDLVRFATGQNNSNITCNPNNYPWRRDLTARPLHSTLNRLREAETGARSGIYRYEDPSYENVHVQWQNGFEFGRSRDYEHNGYTPQQLHTPQLQRARAESPNLSRQQQRRSNTNGNGSGGTVKKSGYGDPFRNYELNTENNTFKPRLVRLEQGNEGVVNTATNQLNETTKETNNANNPVVIMPQPQPLDDFDETDGAVGGVALKANNEVENDAVALSEANTTSAATDSTNSNETDVASNSSKETAQQD